MRRLYDFLAPNSLSAAQKALKAIRQGANHIRLQPAAGRVIEAELPEYREWIVPFGNSAYIFRYRFDEHQVVILALRHGREAGY